MKTNRIIQASLFFFVSIIFGEFTFGNPDFPLTVWTFEKIANWQWSGPVHIIGFIMMLLLNKVFIKKHISIPIILSTLLYVTGETLNWYVFNFFSYGDQTLSSVTAFWFVALMYLGLSCITFLILRKE